MVMSAARSALRMQRLKPDANWFAKYPVQVIGHELDWLALRIGRDDIEHDLDRKSSDSPSAPTRLAQLTGSPTAPSRNFRIEMVEVRRKAQQLAEAIESAVSIIFSMAEIKRKVDVDLRDSSSRTPLLYAAKGGHEAVVKLLLATSKVDVDAKANFDQTPLLPAVEGRHIAVVKLLLATGKVDPTLGTLTTCRCLTWQKLTSVSPYYSYKNPTWL
ncbi:60 kDa lysophospholipase [Tolypocladium ophioglossoides CBS 100239]|uniref:60 kDa lysophospholipase n=1 Tax=Tolypocladium ophioglossoides (strain CBS 100239) TaxID=1163406 RepID=A0A0L0NHW0_TOLOC|nr:60 kDa lysophospholipase [Tolypocladium ophioglossoides CBS 100239]